MNTLQLMHWFEKHQHLVKQAAFELPPEVGEGVGKVTGALGKALRSAWLPATVAGGAAAYHYGVPAVENKFHPNATAAPTDNINDWRWVALAGGVPLLSYLAYRALANNTGADPDKP